MDDHSLWAKRFKESNLTEWVLFLLLMIVVVHMDIHFSVWEVCTLGFSDGR